MPRRRDKRRKIGNFTASSAPRPEKAFAKVRL